MRAIRAAVLCLLLSLPGSAHAQNLVALMNVSGDRQLATIDLDDGEVHLLGSPIAGGSLPSAGGVQSYDPVDPSGNRLFFVGNPPDPDPDDGNLLYSISAANGGVLSNPTFSAAAVGLEYDAGEGVLYGLLSVSGDRQLATINIATGAATLLGSPIAGGSLATASGIKALDAGGNRYFFVGDAVSDDPVGNLLYSVGTASPFTPTSGLVLGPVGFNGIVGMEYDPDASTLYILASVGAPADRQLGTIVTSGPTMGTVTLLGSPIATEELSTSGAEASDPVANRYYFIGIPDGGSPTLYSINTTNGAVADSDALTGPSTAVSGLEFDPTTLPVELQEYRID
jgi:hypothetical protein